MPEKIESASTMGLRKTNRKVVSASERISEIPPSHIDMKPLKQFAYEKLPNCSLRNVLLIEADVLDTHTFLARLPIWLKLIRILDR